MKITLSSHDLNEVKTLIDTQERNMYVADCFSTYLQNKSTSIQKQDIQRLMKEHSSSEYDALLKLFKKRCPIKLKTRFINHDDYKEIKLFDVEGYKNNPYYQNIHCPTIQKGEWTIKKTPYLPYQGFIYDDVLVDEDKYFIETTHLGFFPQTFTYLAVDQQDVNWMSVTPNEIETMKNAIHQVTGHVLTFGLGLGYFAYMAALKTDVSHVTIIEKDQQIIDLFNHYILPQFATRDKITIIHDDAFHFMKNLPINQHYDYAFVDLWHEAIDGLSLYVEMKKHEKWLPRTTFLYWLETSLIVLLRRCLVNLLSEELSEKDINYEHSENIIDDIINRLHFLLKDYPLTSYQDVKTLLGSNSIKKMVVLL